jgi:hypothetical protein
MTIDDLIDIIKTNEKCFFNFYKNEYLYYSFFYDGKECLFPIPIDELRGIEMRFSIRTTNYIGYIRKSIIDKKITFKDIK